MHIPSLKEVVSAEEWQLRCDLAACYRLVAAYGWSDLVFTHISARWPSPGTRALMCVKTKSLQPYSAASR